MDWANGSDASRGANAGAVAQTLSEKGQGSGALDVEEYRGLLRSAEKVLDAVDRALLQLDEGSYGTCAACGEAIDDARLEADPTAQHCSRHDPPGAGAAAPWPLGPAGLMP